MLAQNLENIQKKGFPGFKTSFTDIGGVITIIIPYIFGISGILLLIYLLFGGLQLMFSAGDPKKTQAAQAKITNALIGFVVVFLAYWITQLMGLVLGLQGTLFGKFFGLQ